MFTRIQDFTTEWNQESALTERLLDSLTDVSLTEEVAAGRRTLGRIAWHLVTSIQYMTMMGLTLVGPSRGDSVPESAAAIADEYRSDQQGHAASCAVAMERRNACRCEKVR